YGRVSEGSCGPCGLLLHIKNSELKGKLYREDNLTLDRLIQVIGSYHHKEALILRSPANTNHVSGRARSKPKPKAPSQSGCYKCGAQGHIGRECIQSKNHKCSHCGKRGHFDDFCFHKDKYKSNQDDTPSSQGEGGHIPVRPCPPPPPFTLTRCHKDGSFTQTEK
uniref:CCHC-type domain-containing protein n=1 Tax=Astyanax mexicanus TaxID=7994 RepID=A0A3B1IF47_ASTMX